MATGEKITVTRSVSGVVVVRVVQTSDVGVVSWSHKAASTNSIKEAVTECRHYITKIEGQLREVVGSDG